ncbi:MAG: excinuclease ABC subunit UvrC [Gemmatimonadaceae bacterium]|nr:excinuclease ABC subunit UvrC [Gemmatimonadaceae bacterium]NUR19397.1 excinuclease ABC subunit UvrC [Gemmatimonadaceae bacterium]NUS96287.1 excinuclease ABC subunit UvrC [Gemmatimonadaceae bacterium]
MTTDLLAAKVPTLPESPGVYLWKDAEGTVLYVGKAVRLRSRVRSYVNGDHRASPKTRALMMHAVDVETIVVPTEAHALVLEATLIKEYRPRFNIALRDDKSYPYIKVTLYEPFPRVFVTRRLEGDGSRYFGPYTDVGAMRRALNVVKRIFTVRSCNYDMPKSMPERPCLDYHIGRCKAPCILAQTQEDYAAMIDEVVLFLEGRTDEVVRRVKERMADAAQSLDFERAAELRDVLRKLETMEEPTVVLQVEGGDRDVIGYARDGSDAVVAILRVRDGKLLAREHHFLDNVEDEPDATVLAAYLARTYLTLDARAPELLVPFDFDDRELFAQSLQGTRIHVPQRGPRREIVELAQQNARHLLEESRLASEETTERAGEPIYELQRELGLQRLPRAIVCFDISHAQGTDTVASCVWFQNGRPLRAEYRKFKIRTVEGIDDFASMKEVVSRFVARRIEERKALPDLVVIDGGKGQLNAAREALESQGIVLPIISLAKREEEIFVPGRSESLRLSRRSPALRVLQQARDEAHRFAVTFQRQRRAARTVTSELLSIPGVGPSKRRALIKAFGSVQGVRDAGVEAIAALPGFSAASAQRILEALDKSNPTKPAEPPVPAINTVTTE